MRMCQKTLKLIDVVFEEFIILWFVLLRNESDTWRNPNNVEKVILVKYKYNFLHIIWISLCRIHSLAEPKDNKFLKAISINFKVFFSHYRNKYKIA